jgi:hypothetical protein
VNTDLVWAALRSTRAEAPAGIKGARRKTYIAALEQAQQMFIAAQSVGVATRPLLLFYGLSQGGRAIAAAAKSVGNNDYPLKGHGIKANTSTLIGPIASVEVYADNTAAGSFVRLSTILDSPTWDETAPVKLGELWESIPEGTSMPLGGSLGLPPLPVAVDEYSMMAHTESSPVDVIVAHVPRDLMPPIQHSGPAPELDKFLASYPTLTGYSTMQVKGIYPGSQGGTVQLSFPSAHGDYRGRMADGEAHSTQYRHDWYAFPALGANTRSLHPVMAWWAILFALSMLARYHPETWADHIAVDSSKVAVPIERLLTEALEVVPELLLHTILEVSA